LVNSSASGALPATSGSGTSTKSSGSDTVRRARFVLAGPTYQRRPASRFHAFVTRIVAGRAVRSTSPAVNAVASPHRSPVATKVSTSGWENAGTFSSSSANSSCVSTVISSCVATDLGSSTPAHGFSPRYPSFTAVDIDADSSPCTFAIVLGSRLFSLIVRTHPAMCRQVTAATGYGPSTGAMCVRSCPR
jgi:hypothetical protein